MDVSHSPDVRADITVANGAIIETEGPKRYIVAIPVLLAFELALSILKPRTGRSLMSLEVFGGMISARALGPIT